MVHPVYIQTRALSVSGYDSDQPVETFTSIRMLWCALETSTGVLYQGVPRFSGVTILPGTTHTLWAFWDSEIPDFNTGQHWILDENDIRYRVIRADNVNERDTVVAVQLAVRGSDDYEATKA